MSEECNGWGGVVVVVVMVTGELSRLQKCNNHQVVYTDEENGL